MTLTIEINMDNAAFGECDEDRGNELRRILRELGNSYGNCDELDRRQRIRDLNGNVIGVAAISAE